jgi:hypothetical protein
VLLCNDSGSYYITPQALSRNSLSAGHRREVWVLFERRTV